MSNQMSPLRFPIYKGIGGKFGAIQFLFQRPHFYCSSNKKHKVYGNQVFDGAKLVLLDDMIVGTASFSKEVSCPVCKNGVLGSREGCIFIDTASTISKDKYDWDNKISISLSITDVSKLLHSIRYGQELKLFHDPGAKSDRAGQVTKTINFVPNKDGGVSKGGMFSFFEKNKSTGTDKNVMVPLDGAEVAGLFALLEGVIPHMLSWF